ncbi:TonB-dependent receptor plug domain-containing protein [Horticoccus sp. 23ND18S-11]|uniref:TonB-dependent receptor plug domain-containing protein n=1 Tax=Horticoccus sp. 23ND18S-11 TaxID=3391832 RepID=UPI0039C8F0D5
MHLHAPRRFRPTLRPLVLIGLLSPLFAFAQATTKPTTSPTDEKSLPANAVVLSPFEVNTDRDTGFAATSSLAGGRLAGDLRDTPVAYSVITRDFIDALGITDLQSAAEWTTSSTLNVDNGMQNFFAAPINYTTRGTGNTRPQRNFFPQYNNGDSYNLERYDFGRGPNSILFGNGSLSGVSSSTTKRAQTNRPSRSVQLSVGSWRNYRATFDANQPINDKIALRASGVWGDSSGWRLKDFDKRKAAFLTTTFKPYRGTEIRIEGEYGTNSRQSGFTTLDDRLSGWDGRTVFNAAAGATTLPANANALGIGRRGANYYVYDPFSGANAIMNYQNDPITLAGGASTTTPIAGFVQGALPAFNSNGATFLHAVGVPEHRFATAVANSFFRPPSEEFTISPDAPILSQRFKDLQLTFNQRLGSFYFEIAADINRARAVINGEQNRSSNDTYIDINQVLPNGAPNPHFKQAYGDGSLMRANRKFDYNNVRGAAAYVLDTRWGNFAFNTLGGINRGEEDQDYRYLSVAQGDDHRLWGFLESTVLQTVRIRRYWNDFSRPIPDLSLGTIKYVDPNTRVTKDIQPLWAVNIARRDTERIDSSKFKYILGSINAKFFKNRLVVLGAVRYDSYFFRTVQQIDKGDYPLDWDGVTRIMRPSAPADFASLTYRQRDARGNPIGEPQEAAIRPRLAPNGDRDPLYANDRFKDDYNPSPVQGSQITRSVGSVLHLTNWLNPSINFAETFNPPGGIVRIDARQLEPTISTGTDYGLRMELFQNRLNLNFTYYETKEINGAISQDGPNFFNTLYNANIVGDQSAVGRNIRGAGTLPVQYRDIRTRSGDGFEFEVVYNPSRAFRLTGSVSFPKVYESNLYPDVKAYIDKNAGLFKQIAADTGVLIDANNVASVDLSIPINQRSPDATATATAYNNIVAFRQNIIEGKRLSQDQPIVNVFGDYTMQSGRLKGLRVGAGVRYRGKQIIGSRGSDTIADPANPTRAIDDPTVDAYTPVYTPEDYYIVTATLAYTFRFKNRREIQTNLVINNLLNDRGPQYSSIAQTASALRPKGGDYRSPARETVPLTFALKQPISYNLQVTLKM